MRERLLSLLQTEEHRERFLFGTLSDYRDADGLISPEKVLECLDQSEQVVNDRYKKLDFRHDGLDLEREIARKVSHSMSEIDVIIA